MSRQTAADAPNPAVAVIRAFDDRDFDAGVAAITEDCEVIEVPTGESWKGADGLRREFERWAAGFSDARNDLVNVIDAGDWVVLEGIWMGTHDGDLVLPDQTLAPTGRRLAFPYSTVARIRDGRQAHAKHYYDVGMILRQLGLDR